MAHESEYMHKIEKGLSLVALHRFPEFKEDCKNILNYQWPRSETLRYRSLNASCDELPTSLVFVEYKGNSEPRVLGHARINTLPNDEDSVWIESVIVHHDKRGKGYGRILMSMTESYAYTMGFKTAVLSTHGEEEFYKKLGYTFCSPVSLYGGVVNKLFLPKCFVSSALNNNNIYKVNSDTENFNNLKHDTKSNRLNDIEMTLPPPPPPPLCKLKKADIQRICANSQKVFMKKPLQK